jgi:hypothetical protein
MIGSAKRRVSITGIDLTSKATYLVTTDSASGKFPEDSIAIGCLLSLWNVGEDHVCGSANCAHYGTLLGDPERDHGVEGQTGE